MRDKRDFRDRRDKIENSRVMSTSSYLNFDYDFCE
jgi:hypothetical protein